MLASFFYQGDVPTAESLIDMARECLVAASNSDIDDDLSCSMVEGLAIAWCAAYRHHAENDKDDEHPDVDFYEDAKEAERDYCKVAMRAYERTVRRESPNYKADPESIWWPDGLAYNRHSWPKTFLRALASTAGEIEGDRTVALARYMMTQGKAS
jgi:hypothetical protein